MNRDVFTHETTLHLYDFGPGEINGPLGEIELLITYEVTSWGRPEQGPSYSSGGEPREYPEVDLIHVEMFNAPKRGKPVLIETWDWVHDWAAEWCHGHSDELASVAGLEIEGRKDAAAEAKYEDERVNR